MKSKGIPLKPYQICQYINSWSADSITTPLVIDYLSHEDPAVRGNAVQWIMESLPRSKAKPTLMDHLRGETVESIRTVLKDYLTDL